MSKHVVISGGAQGIGRALSRHFLQQGHSVYLFDIKEDELNHTVQNHLSKYSNAKPPTIASSVCNLRSSSEIRETIDKAAKFFNNRIDILVNMGGISVPQFKDGASMDEPNTLDQYMAYIETNLTAPFAVSQACIPYMKVQTHTDQDSSPSREGGSKTSGAEEAQAHHDAANQHMPGVTAGPCIIHVGSFRAHQSDANQEGYASSKAGLLGLMQSMAITCEQWGIRVNLVAPGRIRVQHESKEGDENGTEWSGLLTDGDVDQHPANRAGTPEDIVDTINWLVGAGFVTGQDITVDGGALRKKNK